MKLIGVIAILAIVAVGCEKEDIRPNTTNPASLEKMATVGGDDAEDEGNDDGAGTGIVDPNTDTDASSGRKKGR